MATRKVKIHEKTGSNTTDILYPQTSADIVDFAGGSDTGHLTSTNAQDAIKEVNTKVVNIGSSVVNTLNGKKSDVTLAGTSNRVTVTPAAQGTETITLDVGADVVIKSENGVADRLVAFSGTNTVKNGVEYGTTGANKLLQLDNNGKVTLSTLPDAILGQLLYGGVVTGAGVATLTPNAQSRLGTSSSSITLTNDTTAVTGYEDNIGIFYIVSSDGNFASLNLLVGDWLISTGSGWTKVDNTDAVTGIKGNAESNYRIGNVNLTPANIGALPDTTFIPTTENEIDKFFTDNPSFVYNGTKMYLHDIASKSLTDADVQAYLTALNTKYGSFTNASVSLIPYTSNRWAVLQLSVMATYTLYYLLPDQGAIYHLSPNSSYVFVETYDGFVSDIAFKADKSNVAAGTYSAVTVNTDGVVTNGYQSLEYGANVGDSTPSANLVEGGLFFEKLS